ncbi:hypothetical protein [Ktedonobacter racemifer]|uniref:Uncharacterized protein n=1 Tax=Ktedonobacter racemifer DSM 44963 TaxID=485913 RepID=D6TS00_KTERA|nr:hypothetical protein [Ktedonobacter racemifer]EFH86073.1 conserved hypothetical protein [Ktedonobacter racemifer DSM 44963]
MALHKKMLNLSSLGVLMLSTLLALSISLMGSGSAAAATSAASNITPRFYYFHHDPPKNALRSNHVPAALATWTSTFTVDGVTYPYTMVGTDPTQGSKTTKIPVNIVPIKVVFGNTVFDGSKKVDSVTDSPLFKKEDFQTGHTQYTDAIQRASFWKSIQKFSPNYHVLLDKPNVKKTFTINVAPGQGELVSTNTNHIYGNIDDINWWDTQMQQLLGQYKATSNGLTIFLTYDVLIELGVGGYHNSTGQGLPGDLTYAWASYYDQYLYSGFSNTGALSHELAEWVADPYTTNVVPSWSVPSEPQYGCSDVLEVGDPLVGVVFHKDGYTLQDEVNFSWFSRQSPSIGYKGRYTYLGNKDFTSYSVSC